MCLLFTICPKLVEYNVLSLQAYEEEVAKAEETKTDEDEDSEDCDVDKDASVDGKVTTNYLLSVVTIVSCLDLLTTESLKTHT